MLLAAGEGRRMLPLTLNLPKPAIPVLGRPIVVQILHRLARHGVDHVVLNLHHMPEVLQQLLGENQGGAMPALYYSHEGTILGTGGGIGKAAPLLRGAGPVLVSNCDFMSEIDIGAAVAAHRQSGRLATLVLAPHRRGYSTIEVDRNGVVLSLAGRPAA
jgi:NDP-sugar pyrophosphorylase family protein